MTTIAALENVIRADHVLGPPQGRWAYAAYAALPDHEARYEILDGVLYMAPAPVPEHEEIIALLAARLVPVITDTGRGRVFADPDVDLGVHVVRPDLVVVLAANQAAIGPKKLVGAPDLVVEVASPSTALYDRDAEFGKRGAYARAGIPEYWIVDPAAHTIEVLMLAEGSYVLHGTFSGTDMISSPLLGRLQFSVQSCFPRES
jgi:Uma2 family endonuclease